MKIWNYIFAIITLSLIFYVAGFDTGTTNLLSKFGIDLAGEKIVPNNSNFWLALFGIGGVLLGTIIAGTGMVAGFFGKTIPENYIILPFITGTLVLFGDFFSSLIKISKAYPEWIQWIVWIIMIPLAVGYLLALIEFFRGSD